METSTSDERQLWNAFRFEVRRLLALEVSPDNLPHYYRLAEAYRALRAHFVKPRKRRRFQKGYHDASHATFKESSVTFRNRYYGADEGHYEGTGTDRKWKPKRRFLGVAPEVRKVMEAFVKLREAWHCHTPLGRKQRAKSSRKYYRTPHGQAKKAAYEASEAGKAARARGIKEASRKRRIARGEAQQRLFDSWATADAASEVMPHV